MLNADEAPRPKDDFVGVMAVRNVEREKEVRAKLDRRRCTCRMFPTFRVLLWLLQLEELNAAGFLGAFERKKYISVDLLQEIFPKRTRVRRRPVLFPYRSLFPH